MLILNEKDIYKSISLGHIMDAIENSYKIYAEEKYFMPDRIHVDKNGKTLLYMPCFLEDTFGTKILTVFPENKAIKKPVINGLMLLNDYESGEPLAMIEGKALTALRTGAVGGVAIRHTTPEDVKTVGLVGAGAQGLTQLQFVCEARKIEKIFVYDIYKEVLPGFIRRVKEVIPHVEIEAVGNTRELILRSEVIITTTTAKEPLFPNEEELFRGKHFIGIGSYKPDMREFPDALSRVVDKVYVDTIFAKEETGDLSQPLESGALKSEQVTLFSEYLLYEKNKEKIVETTTWFKSVGMGIFDIVTAKLIYDRAVEKSIGQVIDF